MVYREEILITYFETGQNAPQEFFEYLIEQVLRYKFRNFQSIAIQVNNKVITEAIFSLGRKDILDFNSKKVDGQKIKELFVASIYLKYIDAIYPDKVIIVSIPREELSYDVAIYINNKGGYRIDEDRRIFKITETGETSYLLQIKEEYDHRAGQKEPRDETKRINPESITKKIAGYDELILIYNRNYGLFSSDDLNKILHDNEKVGFILSPSLEQKEIAIIDGFDKGKTIKFDGGKYNFLLAIAGGVLHIKFDIPRFLSKTPIFGNQFR